MHFAKTTYLKMESVADSIHHQSTLSDVEPILVKKLDPSRLARFDDTQQFQFETQLTAPLNEQTMAQITINKLDKSRLFPFEQQPSSFEAIVKDKPTAGNKLNMSNYSIFNQPSPSSTAAHQQNVTSAPIVNRLDSSRFSLFGQQKQNVQRENKEAPTIVNTNVDEMPLVQLDQVVTEVTDHHENTVSTCETSNKSPIPSRNANDLEHTDEPPVDGERNCASVETFADCVSCHDEGAAAVYTRDEQVISSGVLQELKRSIHCT